MNAKGFTLIELMIVVAIIGILAIVAVPIYQTYVVRSQLTTALAELNGAKIQYELVVNDGSIGTQFTLDGMNLSSNSKLCNYMVYAPVAGVSTPALECRLTKSAVSVAILGQSIQLNRGANGFWYCSVSVGIANRYKPANCS